MKEVIGFLLTVIWLVGIVIAKGFWSTLFSVVFPVWSWYLVAEKSLQIFGVV